MKRFSFLFIFIAFLIFYSCFSNSKTYFRQSDTTVFIAGCRTDIHFPADSIKGTILVLPGWNFSSDDICRKSNFCQLATREGYVLVMPDMLKSVYSSKLYTETRKDWRKYPTINWVLDTLIPFVQKEYKLLLPKQNNFLFGISTGGRGVALIAESSSIFKSGAALSGDYNQVADTSDNLMRGYYGPYYKFPERWNGRDNPLKNTDKLRIPLYLAHGKADNIVPVSQTIEFYNEISKNKPYRNHILKINDTAKHDYSYWQSEYNNVFSFFKKYGEKL